MLLHKRRFAFAVPRFAWFVHIIVIIFTFFFFSFVLIFIRSCIHAYMRVQTLWHAILGHEKRRHYNWMTKAFDVSLLYREPVCTLCVHCSVSSRPNTRDFESLYACVCVLWTLIANACRRMSVSFTFSKPKNSPNEKYLHSGECDRILRLPCDVQRPYTKPLWPIVIASSVVVHCSEYNSISHNILFLSHPVRTVAVIWLAEIELNFQIFRGFVECNLHTCQNRVEQGCFRRK